MRVECSTGHHGEPTPTRLSFGAKRTRREPRVTAAHDPKQTSITS